MADQLHSSLTGSELHEPKGADTASANTVYFADGSGSGSWSSISKSTGWASFTDTGGTQSISASASLGTLITNDKNTAVETYDPADATASLWDSSANKFKPIAVGDIYIAQLSFEMNAIASLSYGVVEIHNGASIIGSQTFGNEAGTSHIYNLTFLIPVDATLLANGGTFNMYKDSGGATMTIDNVKMIFSRIHQGA